MENIAQLKEQRFNELINTCQKEVLDNIIKPFGLSRAMFEDKPGGETTTLRNFKKGITATDKDANSFQNYQNSNQNSIDRTEYNEGFHALRKTMFQQQDKIIDGYTGNQLPKDGRAHIDHIIPAAAYERSAENNLYMTNDDRAKIANSKENLTVTDSSLNQSKNDKDLIEWANSKNKKDPTKTNAEVYGADPNLMKEKYDTAKGHMKYKQIEAAVKKDSIDLTKSSATEGLKMGLQQAIGTLLVELINALFLEIKDIIQNKIPKGKSLIEHFIKRLKKVAQKVWDKKGEAFEAFKEGGLSGILSNILTYIINHFLTTAKKIVTAIREGFLKLMKAVKILMHPPQGITQDEAIRKATKIIASIVTTTIGLLLEESLNAFLLNIPLLTPIADIISPVIAGIFTGIGTALTIYMIDRFFDKIENPYSLQFFSGITNNLEIQNNMNVMMVQILDNHYSSIQNYEKMILQNKAILQINFHIATTSKQIVINMEEDIRSCDKHKNEIASLQDEIIRKSLLIQNRKKI